MEGRVYHSHFKENLGATAEWFLIPPEADELDERGCLSKETCKQIDELVMTEVEKAISGFYMPLEVPHGSDPQSKWRVASSLQKAIRFGNQEHAMFAASVLFDIDAMYLRRRLSVIAAEDVMMGNPFAVAAVMAAFGHPQWRKAMDERRLMMWLARELASSYKDRTLCDLVVFAGEVASLKTTIEPASVWAKWTQKKLLFDAGTISHSLATRMIMLYLACGTKKYEVRGLSVENDRPLAPVFKWMAEQGMTRFGLWMAARVCSRTGYALWGSVYMMDEWLREADHPQFVLNTLPPMPLVGKLLGAAYDQHTREGQTAIAKFFKECKPLHPFLAAATFDKRKFLTWNSVFRGEGGMLNQQVFYGSGQPVYEEVSDGVTRYAGILPEELAKTLIPTVQVNLPLLNECRARVLWARSKA